MEKILVSRCLLGDNTKYNGKNNYTPLVEALKKHFEIVAACPEVDGGLPIPRDPSECLEDKVITSKGKDVTSEFSRGAKIALELCQKNDIRIAVLKDGSPSCGVTYSYDGTFTHTKVEKMGLTAKLLFQNGIKLYTENTIHELIEALD